MRLNQTPYYQSELGFAYLGNSLDLMQEIPDDSIDLICTSPPFALVRKKDYGNVDAEQYIDWFEPFAQQFYRILKPQGSLAIDIGGSWVKGYPTRSLYHFELVIDLCRSPEKGGLGFHLAQEIYWYNPAKLPTPAEWVTVRRERVKDAVNTIWWLSKEPHPKANNRKVLKPYSKAMKNLLKNGYKANLRPSGHDISTKFKNNRGGAIPPNIINAQEVEESEIGDMLLIDENHPDNLYIPTSSNVISASNTSSNDYYQKRCKEEGIKRHPARFPQALPEFFINLCTDVDDIVLDPFAGSNMTGRIAESLKRRWIAIEIEEEYIKGSQFRFEQQSSSVTPTESSENLKVTEEGQTNISDLPLFRNSAS